MSELRRFENRMLTLVLGESAEVDYMNIAAAMIRDLPQVLRVRVDLDAHSLEILHQQPSRGLLQAIHLALMWAGQQQTALRRY